MCLVSAQWPHLLGRLPVEEERLAVGTPRAEQLTVRGETNNVDKTIMDLCMNTCIKLYYKVSIIIE
jgi:hypothetical protein